MNDFKIPFSNYCMILYMDEMSIFAQRRKCCLEAFFLKLKQICSIVSGLFPYVKNLESV